MGFVQVENKVRKETKDTREYMKVHIFELRRMI